MKQLTTIAIFACALIAAPLAKQSPPAQKPDAAQKAGAKPTVSAADRAFVNQMAMDGMAEVAHGQLAAQKGASADVKQFGQRMVDDHSKANDELKGWASSNSVTLPTEIGKQHQAMQDRLSKLEGEAFDRAYMSHMVPAHAKAVAATQRQAKSGMNADLKAWAAKTLPTLQEHHKLARDVNSKLAKGTTGKK